MYELILGDWRKFPIGGHTCIITDPPYTEHVQSRLLAGKKKSDASDAYTRTVACDFDALDGYEDIKKLIDSTPKWSLFFCALEQLGEYQSAANDRWVRSGIYCKSRAMPQMSGDRPGNRCEGISIFHAPGKKQWNGGGTAAYWMANPENRKDTLHPTAKPLMLCMRLVQLFSNVGDVVLDPYAGTGTIGLACKLLGRDYKGFEISTDYVKAAEERYANVMAEPQKYLTKYEAYKVSKGQNE